MANWPNWKDLKRSAKIDPERAAELRRGAQRGVEQSRESLAKRLAGPAAHLRSVGSQFKAGYAEPEPEPEPEPSATPPSEPEPGQPGGAETTG